MLSIRDIDAIFTHDIDRLGWSLWNPTFFSPGSIDRTYRYTEETKDDVHTINIELPGVRASAIEITQEENVVRIKGVRGKKEFEFTYRVPKGYDPAGLVARHEDGVLTLTSRREPSTTPRRIPIIQAPS